MTSTENALKQVCQKSHQPGIDYYNAKALNYYNYYWVSDF